MGKAHEKQPAMIPAVPNPEIARPRIRAEDAMALPEMRDPISKMTTEVRKTVLVENIL